MSDELDRFDESLSVEALERIVRICDAFDEAWKAGQPPRIEALLGKVQDGERSSLLYHLLRVEIDYRRQDGSDPLSAEYYDRFPDSIDLINAAFLASADEVVPLTCPICGSEIRFDDARQQEVTCENCGKTVERDLKATRTSPILPKTIGRFQIIERLGQGSFGVVYKARDPKLKVMRAIKLARPETLDTQDALKRFQRDAQSAARMEHRNIVKVHDIDDDEGAHYIVSDFIEGMDLDERLTGDPFTFHEAARLVMQIAEALEHAHGKGVVHRDVKPSNIMIDHAGTPYLTDFGLARLDEDEISETQHGQILGTPAYMSPEQARGDSQLADARSDVYTLGVVLYELLTTELPFRGKRRMLLHQVQFEEPPPPRRLNDHVPHDLETICLKCLEKEPRNRYLSAQALREDLERYSRDVPILARPISQMTRARRWCARNPLVSGLAGSVVLLLVLLVVVLVLWLRSEADRRAADANRYETVTTALLATADMTEELLEFAQTEIPKGELDSFGDLDDELAAVIDKVPDLAPFKKHVPVLTEALKVSSNPVFRLRFVEALGKLGDAAALAILTLEWFAEDDESPSQKDAEAALEDIRAALEDAIPALREASQDGNSQVASEAEKTLAAIRSTLDVKLRETTVEDHKK